MNTRLAWAWFALAAIVALFIITAFMSRERDCGRHRSRTQQECPITYWWNRR